MASDWMIGDNASEEERRSRWKRLPHAGMGSTVMTDPQLYFVTDRAILDAIHTAIILGQPLLVTGEPGVGKTELANYVAYQLGLEHKLTSSRRPEYALRFDVKSTTKASDLFYTFDVVGRFHAAQHKDTVEDIDPRRFTQFHALGRALLDASDPDQVDDLWGLNYRRVSREPRRNVVLIDEIDKAARDVPNDLLMELEQMSFFITELDRTVRALPEYRPIVIITSNSERSLPDPFLRRCVFLPLKFPPRSAIERVVLGRLKEYKAGSPLLAEAMNVFFGLRDIGLRKAPATAELLGFVQALTNFGWRPQDGLISRDRWTDIARVSLLKTKEDQDEASDGLLLELARGPTGT
jgi:MoxR-like ATPase